MSHTPNYDAAVKAVLDATLPGERMCSISSERWKMTEEELNWCRLFNVPPSDVHPMARRRWLLGFNVGVEIWWNKDMLTGEKILSYVHPDNKIPVVDDTRWYAEDWSQRASLNLDVSRSVFDQLRELHYCLPVPALRTYNPPVNTIGASLVSVENSFMVFAGVKNTKRSAYGWLMENIEDCQEVFFGSYCSNSSSIVHCERLFDCHVAINSHDCLHSRFLFDCRNCENVFGGFNLRNRKYIFWGKQLSESEYHSQVGKIDLRSYTTLDSYKQNFFRRLDGEAVWPENFNIQAEASTGEYLMRCLRCRDSFSITDCTDLFHSQIAHTNSERCAYSSGFNASSDLYMCAGMNKNHVCRFCSNCGTSQDLEYCLHCYNCEHCFGCIGLNRKKFHIANQPFTEEEYWRRIDELKCAMMDCGEYGRFFPGDFSPSGVENATRTLLDYPEQEFYAIGAVRFDPDAGAPKNTDVIDPDTLPDRLDACEDYIGKSIMDRTLNRAFSVRQVDYEFYQKHNLPFPRRHYIARLISLARLANTFTMGEDTCACCHKKIFVADNLTFKRRKTYCMQCYTNYLEKNS